MKKFFCVLCGICLFYMGYAQEKEVKAVIETNLGNMIVKLYNDTPNHRDNFVRLAKAGPVSYTHLTLPTIRLV